MSDVQVAVVSHARADVVGAKTLRLLADRGVPRELVRLYVTPDQLADYQAAVDPGLVANIEPGAPGLAAQRRHVALAYPEGTQLVQLDDDVTDVVRRVDDKHTEPVADLLAECRRGFTACADHGARLWGIYPVLNAMFMKPRIRTGLVFCIGHLWGVVNSHAPERQVQLANKEDYERTLRYHQADGVVVRLDDVAARTRMFGAGGLQAADQPERSALNRMEVVKLRAWWPQHVVVSKRRSKVGLPPPSPPRPRTAPKGRHVVVRLTLPQAEALWSLANCAGQTAEDARAVLADANAVLASERARAVLMAAIQAARA